MSTFGIRLLCAAFLLFCCGFFQQSHASRDAVFGLCDVDDVISARNGSLVVTKGVDCTKVILAPRGWRIKFTLYEIRNFDAVTSIHDGGTVIGTRKYEYGIGVGVPTNSPSVYYSSSNALSVHTAKISSTNSKFNATFEMFTHSRDNCLCPPTINAQTVCTFPPVDDTGNFYPNRDVLKKTCAASCESEHGTGVYSHRYKFNRIRIVNSVRSFSMTCNVATPSSTWVSPHFRAPAFDPRLISCTKVFLATQVSFVYYFAYANVSCREFNKTKIEDDFHRFLVNKSRPSHAGECFKPRGKCTISKPVLWTCVSNYDKKDRHSKITVKFQDNVKITENDTVTQNLFDVLYNDFRSSAFHKKVQGYVQSNLVIRNITATKFQGPRIYINCLKSPATTSGSPRKCISCPLHTFKHFYSDYRYSTCERCPFHKRRLLNESMCVNGPKVYPSKPSNKYCVHKCPLGKFFSFESGICEWCDYGFFQDSTTNVNPVCHPCPGGTTTAFVGAKSEKNCMYRCSEGQFTKFPSCVNCSIGYYMPYKGNRFSECFKCPPGKTTLNEGTANKIDCVEQCTIGEYFDISLGVCVLCPNNTYQDEQKPGNTRSCKTCPANTVTLRTGASSRTACLDPCSAEENLDVEVRQIKDAYLQVDFSEVVQLTGIAMPGLSHGNGSWLRSYQFNFSIDGANWLEYEERPPSPKIFGANEDLNTVVRINLTHPLRTRYVRIIRNHTLHRFDVRWAFYGCLIPLPTYVPPRTTGVPSNSTDEKGGGDYGDGNTARLVAVVVLGTFAMVVLISFVICRLNKRRRSGSSRSSERKQLEPKSGSKQDCTTSM